MMVTVIVHSLPFHCHFLVISIKFSNDVENFNKSIHLRRFSILDHNLTIICPIKVSSDINVLDSCNAVWIDNNIEINEKNCVLTHVVVWSIGTNDMKRLVWVDSYTDVLIYGLTQDSNRQLKYWYTNIYCIVVGM